MLMQAAERCLICSTSYEKEKMALLRAQRMVKAWLAKRQYTRATGASLCLQAYGNAYLAKRWMHGESSKVAFIQAVIRGWLERSAFVRLRQAAMLMQAAERCLACSAGYGKDTKGLLTAQRLVKQWLCCRAECRQRFRESVAR